CNKRTKLKKESRRDSMFFDIVLKKDKVEILEIFLDKKNKNFTEDTILVDLKLTDYTSSV
ncbi:MAG: hypothetical protein Q8N83_05450, partial [Ignavibacteria bacterium]|nr:hypothetical protein [Ignavibacteria bacterium]